MHLSVSCETNLWQNQTNIGQLEERWWKGSSDSTALICFVLTEEAAAAPLWDPEVWAQEAAGYRHRWCQQDLKKNDWTYEKPSSGFITLLASSLDAAKVDSGQEKPQRSLAFLPCLPLVVLPVSYSLSQEPSQEPVAQSQASVTATQMPYQSRTNQQVPLQTGEREWCSCTSSTWLSELELGAEALQGEHFKESWGSSRPAAPWGWAQLIQPQGQRQAHFSQAETSSQLLAACTWPFFTQKITCHTVILLFQLFQYWQSIIQQAGNICRRELLAQWSGYWDHSISTALTC